MLRSLECFHAKSTTITKQETGLSCQSITIGRDLQQCADFDARLAQARKMEMCEPLLVG
jgi:hypothetical protein